MNCYHVSFSGAVSGKWEQASDSAAATLTIGNQRYSGYFIAAENEKGTKVMSFTAVGSNNQSIWGAQNKKYTGSERASLADYTNLEAELVMAPETVGKNSKSVKLSGTDLISGATYYITNKNSELSLDLPEGALDAGTNIQQWDFKKSWAQQWRLVSVDDSYFRIVSLGDESKCVAVAENSASDGVNVELQSYTGADNQLFSFVKSGSYYGIVSKCSAGKGALDVFEWSTENGGNVNQYAYNEYDCQLWKVEAVCPSVPDGTYTIKNLNSGRYIAGKNGSAVQSDSQSWNITKQNDGTYTIQAADGRALTVENNSAEDGADIKLAEFKGDSSQKFNIQCSKDGTYFLLTVSSGSTRCADVYEISLDDGANICQWDYWGGDGQHFVLEAVPETENDITDVCLPVELAVSRNTNPFAGNITKQNEHYNYGGDPAAFVDGDTVYAYTGHDVSSNAEVDSAIYNIPEYLCYSTKDLINWNYEGVVMKMSDVSWGDPKSAWAGQVTKHNGRYYLYFCSWDRTSEGKQSIGVANVEESTYVSIESENKTGLFVTEDVNGKSAVLSQITTLADSDLKRATFRTIEGLADHTKVSFESIVHPGTYLTSTAYGDIALTDGSDPASCTFSISPDGIIPSVIKGDVNADGAFNISDLLLLQKWLLAFPDTKLKNWQAGDLCEDNNLDAFDLCEMRRELVAHSELNL